MQPHYEYVITGSLPLDEGPLGSYKNFRKVALEFMPYLLFNNETTLRTGVSYVFWKEDSVKNNRQIHPVVYLFHHVKKTYLLVDSGFLTFESRRKCTQKKFKCCKCGKSIMGDDEWEEHIRNHLINDDFICHKCGMDFPSLTELIEHNRVHRPSCSKHWDLKSENNDREKKNLRGKDGVSRKLKFDKPTVLHDLRNRNENMPELMKQVDELKLQASLIFNNEIKRKGMKKLNYPILNSRCAKKGAQLLSKWKKYLDDEKNEFVNYPGTTKYEEPGVSDGVNNDHIYFSTAITKKELLKQKEEVLFYSSHQGVGDDVIKPETLDEDGGAFIRMFHKYLETEKEEEEKKEKEEEKEDDTEEMDEIKIVLDDDGITKYEKASVSSGGNDDYLYFAPLISPEELLKQKEEFLFYSKRHLKDQGVGDDVIKAETLDEEGGAFVRMFHKYLEAEKEKEEEKENEEEKDDDTEETDVIKIVLDEDDDEFDEMWWL
ncbi:Zinc finger protein [Trichinella zimbabwensis]|uniref:Zinc finger protein n=1 Tax=Trichinella zimbabwensis TaxID=268475 RepID=A0A0V1HJQ7_9BILA|nr:Zinc finger protein [Trichinella zimbabwensis]